MKFLSRPERFWSEIDKIEGSATPYVLRRTLVFGLIAFLVTLDREAPDVSQRRHPAGPLRGAGRCAGRLAGPAHQCRVRAVVGGPQTLGRNRQPEPQPGDPGPQLRSRRPGMEAADRGLDRGLRPRLSPEPAAERHLPELDALVGNGQGPADRVGRNTCPPPFPWRSAGCLREGAEKGMDRFAFLRAEEERAKLIDHIGGCERILKTPLPEAYSIEIRQFIFVFLVALPFGILLKVDWLTPLVTMLVAFPILALDEIGVELQNPFSQRRLNHLPLDQICENLEANLMALLGQSDDLEDTERRFPGRWPVSAGDEASAHARLTGLRRDQQRFQAPWRTRRMRWSARLEDSESRGDGCQSCVESPDS